MEIVDKRVESEHNIRVAPLDSDSADSASLCILLPSNLFIKSPISLLIINNHMIIIIIMINIIIFWERKALPDLISQLSDESTRKLQASVRTHAVNTSESLLLRPPMHQIDQDRLAREAAYAQDKAELTKKWEGILFILFVLINYCHILVKIILTLCSRC